MANHYHVMCSQFLNTSSSNTYIKLIYDFVIIDFVSSNDQLTNMLAKSLDGSQIDDICVEQGSLMTPNPSGMHEDYGC